MKTLILFFSRTGNNKFLAQKIKEHINADIEEIKIKNTNKFENIKKFLLTALPFWEITIQKPTKNPKEYELMIFLSPIRFGNIPSPIQTYIKTYLQTNKAKYAYVSIAWGTNKKDQIDKKAKKLLKKSLSEYLQLYLSDMAKDSEKNDLKKITKMKLNEKNYKKYQEHIKWFIENIKKL